MHLIIKYNNHSSQTVCLRIDLLEYGQTILFPQCSKILLGVTFSIISGIWTEQILANGSSNISKVESIKFLKLLHFAFGKCVSFSSYNILSTATIDIPFTNAKIPSSDPSWIIIPHKYGVFSLSTNMPHPE